MQRIILVLIAALLLTFGCSSNKTYKGKADPGTIHVNQLGYRPGDAKKAVIPQKDTEFYIVRASDDSVAYKGTAGELIEDVASRDTVRVADFSAFTEEGEYFLRTAEGSSYPFVIRANPYSDVRAALLDMFNYQKCGVAVDRGVWSHPACHTSSATINGTNDKLDVSGGWHDAGDYGRYIVPAAKAVADLLLAYELSSNPDPELLEMVWFEVEWMLKMQDAKSGGVYHKVSARQFNSLAEKPQNERSPLVLSPISPTATADFAAAMALASRFYPDKKNTLLNASKLAWDWCVANPNAPNFKNPQGIVTGEYGDGNNRDERFWAACELFAATGEQKYHDAIKSGGIFAGLGWDHMGTYGLAAYLFHTGDKADDALLTRMKDKLLSDCETIITEYYSEPYGVSLGPRYVWGSNMSVGNNAMMLLLGRQYVEDSASYNEAALEHFHYLLGRNPLSKSYVTGFGASPPKYPHHRPSVAVGRAVPGMVAGGPNMNIQDDPILKTRCIGLPPSKCYVDHQDSYASNEITIYWNSPAYFIAAVLDL